MASFFTICMLTAMASVFGVLILGLISMVKGGEFDKKYANRLMQARVMLQALALVFLALAWLQSPGG
jgi:hypothetical protein